MMAPLTRMVCNASWLGQMAAAGTGSADLVCGMRAASATAPGQYTAGITATAVAPNA